MTFLLKVKRAGFLLWKCGCRWLALQVSPKGGANIITRGTSTIQLEFSVKEGAIIVIMIYTLSQLYGQEVGGGRAGGQLVGWVSWPPAKDCGGWVVGDQLRPTTTV